ncbi:MAG: alkaline phosphatase D family protein [Rhodospirillaceae bacterium]|nr:alkaline phosphatase D family protein [Rhodospirillaceae bacterium]
MTGDLTRRDALTGSVAIAMATAAVTVSAEAATSDPHPALERTLARIAFGSCCDQEKDQPIWDHVVAAKPDLFVFLGDNIYGDSADMNMIRARYAKLAAKPGFKKLRATTPIAAIWDDHDYGEDDAGANYPFSRETQKIFLDFFGEPSDSPRWSRNGLYASYIFGPKGKRVQLILPDLRMHRSALVEMDLGGRGYKSWAKDKEKAGEPVPGPYQRNPDPNVSMLGEAQWAWLEEQFKVPADIRLFGSSLQVLADFPGWEAWINFTRDHQRLIEVIGRTKAGGVIFLSGDTHYGEISKLDVNVPYPLWDVTSSGLTEVWPVLPPNDNRVGPAINAENFGVIEIDWKGRNTKIRMQVRGGDGATKLEQQVDLKALSV